MTSAGHWRGSVAILPAPLMTRWLSIPVNVRYQAVVPERDWVVVSFHTVPAAELIEERPDSANPVQTIRRHYVSE